MIILSHPLHGTKTAYSQPEVDADKVNGWEELKELKEDVPSVEQEKLPWAQAHALLNHKDHVTREELFAMYQAKYGKAAHGNRSKESLLEALNANSK